MVDATVDYTPDDQIHIEQLRLFGRVGVSDAEREKPQALAINITLWPSRRIDDLDDQIDQATDYAAVCEETQDFIKQREDHLIETLANSVAMFLLNRFSVRQVRIELRKFVLPDAAYTAVIVTRIATRD